MVFLLHICFFYAVHPISKKEHFTKLQHSDKKDPHWALLTLSLGNFFHSVPLPFMEDYVIKVSAMMASLGSLGHWPVWSFTLLF